MLGVDADVGPHALTGFRGPVRVTIQAGLTTDVVRAVANPAFEPDGSMVLRTSRHATGDTFAISADKGAGQLDRALIAELAQPGAVVAVTVEEEPASGRPVRGELTVVALSDERPDYLTPDAREALTRADVVVAAGRAQRLLVEAAAPEATVRSPGKVDVRAHLAADERLVGMASLPTDAGAAPLTDVAHAAREMNAALRVVPEPSLETIVQVAASKDAGPYVALGGADPGRSSRAELLELGLSTGACLAWRETGESLDEALTETETKVGDRPIRVCVGIESRQGLLLDGTAADVRRQWGDLGRPPGKATVLVARTRGTTQDGRSGQTDALLAALLAEGVPARTVAQALSSLPGHDYRSDYRHVLRVKTGDGPG